MTQRKPTAAAVRAVVKLWHALPDKARAAAEIDVQVLSMVVDCEYADLVEAARTIHAAVEEEFRYGGKVPFDIEPLRAALAKLDQA